MNIRLQSAAFLLLATWLSAGHAAIRQIEQASNWVPRRLSCQRGPMHN